VRSIPSKLDSKYDQGHVMSDVDGEKAVNVFVLLGHDFGCNTWQRKHALGLIPGLNDHLAYGYYRAAGGRWSIEYSQDSDEGRFGKVGRLALRKLLGFDLIHVWQNRRRLLAADIVWTHTELEHLGVLALFGLLRQRHRPKLIANCVWLFDRWARLSRIRRSLYQQLLKRADIVTTLSPENLEVARQLLPSVRCECVLFGAVVQKMASPRKSAVQQRVRIASLGSDMHRDWETLLAAFGNIPRYEVRIASSKINPKLLAGLNNVQVTPVQTADDVSSLYEWADLAAVALKPNLHASGITVVFEATVSAVPLICTDTGGLRAYFSDAEVAYVPPGAPLTMRAAAEELSKDDERRFSMIVKAQNRLISAELTAQGFAMRNRRLSEELLCNSATAF
jgi:glycosyltransferase involved in cell wall biosynthesis